MPVGLCAQACRRMIDCSGAAYKERQSTLRNSGQNAEYLQISLETLKVQSDCAFVEIPVTTDFKTRITKYGCMVAPGWHGEVDDLGVWVVASEKGSANSEGTCAGDGLCYGDLERKR